MEKIYNLLFDKMSNFIEVVIAIPFIVFPLFIIGFTIYMLIKNKKFKKNATIVKTKVKEVEKVMNPDNTCRGYKVTFEFEYNGELREETIFSSKRFKIDSVRDALYLEDKKKNILSVEGEGFYGDKGAGFFVITFCMFVLYLVFCAMFNVSKRLILESALLYILFLFGGLAIRYLILNKDKIFNSNKKKQKTDDKDKVFHNKAGYDEYSTVNSNLVRYIPEYKEPKKRKRKRDILDIIFNCVFIGLGTMVITMVAIPGLMLSLKIVVIGDSTTARISNIYEKTKINEKEEELHVVYSYEVDGHEYTLDYVPAVSKDMYFKKVGSKEKLYYEKGNPSNSIPVSLLLLGIIPLIIGLLFIYVGVHEFIEEKKKQRLYDAYIRFSEGN